MKRRQSEIAIICYCAIKNALNGRVHSSIRRLLSGYQTSHFYMRVVFSSLVVSCQGHGRNGKLESLKSKSSRAKAEVRLGYNIGYNFICPSIALRVERFQVIATKYLSRR